MSRLRFALTATVTGWRSLVNVWNHVGLGLAILVAVGLVAGTLQFPGTWPWWAAPAFLLGAFLLCLFEGAYEEWRALAPAELLTAFPDVLIKATQPLVVGTEDSKSFPGERETLIAVGITVTNRGTERRAILAFSAHVNLPEPRPMMQRLMRTRRGGPEQGFLPDPLKLDPQDQAEGEALFIWTHEMDFLLSGRSEEEVVDFVLENLRVSVRDAISTVSIEVELPEGKYRF